MASSNGTAPTVEGIVARVNGYGFTLEGHEGWLNISKFTSPDDAPMPETGQHVKITLDKGGYVRRVQVVESAPASESEQPASVASDRDRLIVRQSSLKAAIEILASGGRAVDAKEVVALAGKLEAWVLR